MLLYLQQQQMGNQQGRSRYVLRGPDVPCPFALFCPVQNGQAHRVDNGTPPEVPMHPFLSAATGAKVKPLWGVGISVIVERAREQQEAHPTEDAKGN
jgi:hypothetical protein